MPIRRRELIVGAAAAAASAGLWRVARPERPLDRPSLPFARVVGTHGPVVVFVHGFLGSSSYWSATFDSFAPTRRLVFVDLPGFGRSLDMPGPYDIATHAARIRARIDQMQPERVVMAGHSMGALVALHAAQGWPAVRAVVAFNAPLYESREQARALVARTGVLERWTAERSILAQSACEVMCALRPAVRLLAPALAPEMPHDVAEGAVDHTWASYAETFESMVETDARHLVETCGARVVVVAGQRDRVCPLDVVHRALRGVLAEVRVVDAGHHVPLERPHEARAIVGDVLSSKA